MQILSTAPVQMHVVVVLTAGGEDQQPDRVPDTVSTVGLPRFLYQLIEPVEVMSVQTDGEPGQR